MRRGSSPGRERWLAGRLRRMRRLDARASQVAELLGWAADNGFRSNPEFATWFATGEALLARLDDAAGGRRGRPPAARTVRRWDAEFWRRLECEASREAEQALERAVLQSGLTPEEAVVAMSRGINEGMELDEVVEALANGELRP